MRPPNQQRPAVPIDHYLADLNARKEALQLQLNQINTQMATIRAHYSQARSNWIFKPSPHAKDHQLRKLQPTKEHLQTQIAAIRTEIARIKVLKKQGIQWITL